MQSAAIADGDRMVREDECRQLTGLSRATRWRQERRGTFPKRCQLSDNAVGWRLADLRAWLNERPR
jgi:prophage regulatory protein